jgi:multicomponent Na+:H+ antiporter subunit E
VTRTVRRTLALLRLGWLFIYELVVSSVQVAWDVATPRHRSRPGILEVPLDARTDLEITVLSNLICLTPGTLSLEVSANRSVLYVHFMFIDDPGKSRRMLKEALERRVLEALR